MVTRPDATPAPAPPRDTKPPRDPVRHIAGATPAGQESAAAQTRTSRAAPLAMIAAALVVALAIVVWIGWRLA